MPTEDDYSKFLKNLSKIVSTQWYKVTRNVPSSEKSDKNVDEQLEYEYETLLREIDYLSAEKDCYLTFQNDNFNKAKSSNDLTKILKKHSSEVLKNYIKKHDNGKNKKVQNRHDLINYVTEIVLSKHKCNNKLCSCKPKKISREVLTDANFSQETERETQTGNVSKSPTEKATNIKPIINQKIIQTQSDIGSKKATVFIQTDDWSQDPFCKCGCCPKTKSEIDTKSVTTDEKPVKDATTSDKKLMASKDVLANCIGESIETNTSGKLCVPEKFEKLMENNKTLKFSPCTEKKDCACEVYDVKEALNRGIVLPSSDVCIQKKRVSIFGTNQKDRKTGMSDSTDGTETTDTSSSPDNKKKKVKEKKKAKEKKSKEKKTKEKKIEDSESNSTPREKPKKQNKEETTRCFGTRKKKKSRCDEYCLGISEEHRSMQTMPISYKDKNEEAYFSSENGRKAAQTSTDSEVAVQISAPTSHADLKKSKRDKETWLSEDNKQGYSENKGSATDKDKNKRDKENREKLKDAANVCSKCGRLKRDCVSGCRNTIIIPYGSGSNNRLPAGEVESLRMLIKMQNKDTNRQFDSILSELNQQKSEVRRLNEMYQKMIENFYELQKTTETRNEKSSSSKRSVTGKECGCSSNECKIVKKRGMPTGSYDNTGSNNSNNTYNGQLKRFGPLNTAVAINRCDICNVEIDGKIVRTSYPLKESDYHDGDKQRKDQLNQSKKENIASREIGDGSLPKQDSVSTIYKKEKRVRKQGESDRKYDRANKNDLISTGEESDSPKKSGDVSYVEGETHSTDPGKKPRETYSSRIILWLKRSWVSIKRMREECKRKDEEEKENRGLKHMFNSVHGKAKQAATGILNAAKRVKKGF